MWRAWSFALSGLAIILATAVHAADRGMVIRAGDIKTQPFIDSATAANVTANEPVAIVDRKGGWMQVEAAGKTGWIRMLNVRLAGAEGSGGGRSSDLMASASLLRTGSAGKTVTTGVKGLGEEDLRNATVNLAELNKLSTFAVDPPEATANAQKSRLKENQIDYLTKEGKK